MAFSARSQRVCTGCKLVSENSLHVDERAIYILKLF